MTRVYYLPLTMTQLDALHNITTDLALCSEGKKAARLFREIDKKITRLKSTQTLLPRELQGETRTVRATAYEDPFRHLPKKEEKTNEET